MEVILHYVDIKVIYDNMHDYFANVQHYKVEIARKYTRKILKYYLLWLEKKNPNNTNIEKAFFCRQTQTDGRTETDIKQTDTWTSTTDIFFSNKMLDAK